MKVDKWEGGEERRILIGMIVDGVVLSQIRNYWNGELFRSDWCNIVGDWCTKYYDRYGSAPGKEVQALFESWASNKPDRDTVQLVGKFLGQISNEYQRKQKDRNSQHTIDLAAKHFNSVRFEKLADELRGDVGSGKLKSAFDRVNKFSQIEMGVGAGIDVLSDKQAIYDAFKSKRDPLVEYPGPLGILFADALERDAFVGFMGPTGRGKSFWLLDVAWRAMTQRRKVAYFQGGDMSQDQAMRRFCIRASVRPFFRKGDRKTIKYPVDLARDPDDLFAVVKHEEREYKSLKPKKAYKTMQKMLERELRSKDPLLKLSVHPSDSITVDGISSILQTWDRLGWTPDVVVIDYADLLAPVNGTADTRDQINTTWKRMRAISQTLHILLVTATQTDAASFSASTITRSNFSEDRRKLDHVTGMVGINMTDEEKENGQCRLNMIKLRDSEFVESRCIYCAGSLALANPAIRSCF